MCAVLDKPLMPAYQHWKEFGRLPVLTSLAMTNGVTLRRWHIVPPWTCPRAEHPSSSYPFIFYVSLYTMYTFIFLFRDRIISDVTEGRKGFGDVQHCDSGRVGFN